MRKTRRGSVLRFLIRQLCVSVGAVVLTALFFLLLPVIQRIADSPLADTTLRSVDTAAVPPPPPPPPEEEPEPEDEPEEAPPEMMESLPTPDLSSLELALNAGHGGGGWAATDFNMNMENLVGQDKIAALFSLSDLDQKPRILYQPGPILDSKLRKKAPGTVTIIFVVDERGRVKKPVVQSSTDPVFERAALAAIRQWRFEPGKRKGEPVQFRMRIPITFPKSQ